MTIYEITLLFNIHCLADPFEHHADTPLRHETMKEFLACGLIDRTDFPSLTDKGRCFIESLQATPLPTCVWRGSNGVEVQA